jgi:fumarylacetoacetate (FAA) hydrolase family protein
VQTSPREGTVRIAASELGAPVNEVVTRDQAEPWSFGAGALMAGVARRGLLMDKGRR